MSSLLLKNGIVFYNDRLQKLDLLIENKKIKQIAPVIDIKADEIINVNGLSIIPGLVDIHTHLREPGFTYKEDINSGTLAAAHGGFTTICCMPNLNPVTDSVVHMNQLLDLIKTKSKIKVLPYAAITLKQQNKSVVDIKALTPLCFAFSDDGVGVTNDHIMREAMLQAYSCKKTIVSHCELPNNEGIDAEVAGIARDLELVKQTKCQYHVCHVSTKKSLELVKQAKAQSLPVTCEVTPHHLLLNTKQVLDHGDYKMNPPIRHVEDQQAMIDGIINHDIDMIVTDHAPHSQEEKDCVYKNALNGIVGLETSFPLMYTNFVKNNKISFKDLVHLMSTNPCRLFKLPGGEIKIGEVADLAIFDLKSSYKINPKDFLSKGHATPFSGYQVYGKIRYTIVNGCVVGSWK